MLFLPTKLPGAYLIELEPRSDARGFFARQFCQNEFLDHGLVNYIAQCNVSWNECAGTLRGMHYQLEPFAETKLVRCTRGALYDVMVDLRPNSPTYCEWFGVELTAENRKMVYVPQGFAHGYQALTPDTEALYMSSEFYTPTHERAVRWNDPAFNIRWPLSDPILSDKDRTHLDYIREERHERVLVH